MSLSKYPCKYICYCDNCNCPIKIHLYCNTQNTPTLVIGKNINICDNKKCHREYHTNSNSNNILIAQKLIANT